MSAADQITFPSILPLVPPSLFQSHGQITWVCVCSQPFLGTAAALLTLEKQFETCKGTISVQWICHFPCLLKSLPSLTRVQVFDKSLHQDSVALSPWNSKDCNTRAGMTELFLPTFAALGFYRSGQELVFPRTLSAICFFLFVTGRGWSCLIQTWGINGVKLMHEETAGKETGRERKWKLVERRKTGSRIYDREKVGFKG